MSIVQATRFVTFCHGDPRKRIHTPRWKASCNKIPPESARATPGQHASLCGHSGSPAQSLPLISRCILTASLSAQTPSRLTPCGTSFVPASGGALWGVRLAADSSRQVPLSSPGEPSLEMIKRSERGDIKNLRKQMKTHRLLYSRGF